MMWKAKFALPWHRKQDRNIGEGVRGAYEDWLLHGSKASSSHTFNSVNRHHCVVLKRQAADGDCGLSNWLNYPGIAIFAILQPL